MKQTLLLMLALGMYSINVSAQTKKRTPVKKTTTTRTKSSAATSKKEYRVELDGFEWYKVCKNGKYGAEDRNGTLLIPTEYNYVYYGGVYSHYFVVGNKEGFIGVYTPQGNCIMPITRHYINIDDNYDREHGSWFVGERINGGDLFDANGRIVCSIEYNAPLFIYPDTSEGISYLKILTMGKINGLWKAIPGTSGIADFNGKIIMKPQYESVYIYKKKIHADGKEYDLISSMTTTNNLLANNPIIGKNSQNNCTSSSFSSSSNSSSNNNNSGGGTTTVVVEHKHDPIPVQEWVQCTACWGSTICPNCAGSGTTYIGSNLHRCSRCGGRKICTSCSGQGGRYITVCK